MHPHIAVAPHSSIALDWQHIPHGEASSSPSNSGIHARHGNITLASCSWPELRNSQSELWYAYQINISRLLWKVQAARLHWLRGGRGGGSTALREAMREGRPGDPACSPRTAACRSCAPNSSLSFRRTHFLKCFLDSERANESFSHHSFRFHWVRRRHHRVKPRARATGSPPTLLAGCGLGGGRPLPACLPGRLRDFSPTMLDCFPFLSLEMFTFWRRWAGGRLLWVWCGCCKL